VSRSGTPRRFRWAASFAALILLLSVLAACTGDDDESGDQTPTLTTAPTTAPTATAASITLPTKAPAAPAASPAAAASPTKRPTFAVGADMQVISDGVCTAAVPEDWFDDGTGRGTTSTNARYVLFGGRVSTDDAWVAGVQLLEDQAKKTADAVVTKTDDSIRIDLPGNRGFEYRARFGNRYCDISVTASSEIPESERAAWDTLVASLSPVE
jgi:hypothetical protein